MGWRKPLDEILTIACRPGRALGILPALAANAGCRGLGNPSPNIRAGPPTGTRAHRVPGRTLFAPVWTRT